jgi:membrane-bound lytic murein transglycosylase MltF
MELLLILVAVEHQVMLEVAAVELQPRVQIWLRVLVQQQKLWQVLFLMLVAVVVQTDVVEVALAQRVEPAVAVEVDLVQDQDLHQMVQE